MTEITEANLFSFPSSDGLHTVAGYRFPVANPRAVVQISHGMIEHVGHYTDLISRLNAAGIAVYANDHLGHGKTAKPEEYGIFGKKGSREFVLQDLHTVTGIAKSENPELPFILIGHSMGSFLARIYASRWGDELDGLVILGTGGPNPALPVAKTIAALSVGLLGPDHPAKVLSKLAFGSYNSRYEKGVPEKAWITSDQKELDKFEDDPASNFKFSAGGFRELFAMIGEISRKSWAKKLPKDLPILLASGDMDPVGGWGKGVKKVNRMLEDAGCEKVTFRLYPGFRHELHNEVGRDEFYRDLLAWTEGLIP